MEENTVGEQQTFEEDEFVEQNVKSVQQKIQIICRTAERYFQEGAYDQGKQIIENLEKFRVGSLSLTSLHSSLFEKDRLVGGITEINEQFVPQFIMRVQRGLIPFIVPIVPKVTSKPTSPTTQPTQPTTSNDQDDSFDRTVTIVPKSQEMVRNSVKIISFTSLSHHQFHKLDSIHRYIMRYVNLFGQVVAVFKTVKNNTFLRFWDGTGHQLERNLFTADDNMISYYFSPPKTSLEILNSAHFVDINVYGEYIEIVQNLRSGDMVALTNLHIFRSKYHKEITLTIHDGGEAHGRNVYLINDEEDEVIGTKTKLREAAEKLLANPNATLNATGEISKMSSFWNSARPSAQVRPLQTSVIQESPNTPAKRQAQPVQCTDAPTFFSAKDVLACQGLAESNGRKHVFLEDSDEDGIERPPNKLKRLFNDSEASHGSLAHPLRRPERARAPLSPAVKVVLERQNALAASLKDKNTTNESIPSTSAEVNIKEFLRQRWPSPPPQTVEPRVVVPRSSTSKSIAEFLSPKPIMKSIALQTNPEKKTPTKSRSVQADIYPSVFHASVQTSMEKKQPTKSCSVQADIIPIVPYTAVQIDSSKEIRNPRKTARKKQIVISERHEISSKGPSNSSQKNISIKIEPKEELSSRGSKSRRSRQTDEQLHQPPYPPPRGDSLTRDHQLIELNMSRNTNRNSLIVTMDPPQSNKHANPPPVPAHASKGASKSLLIQLKQEAPPLARENEIKPIITESPGRSLRIRPKEQQSCQEQTGGLSNSISKNTRSSTKRSLINAVATKEEKPIINEALVQMSSPIATAKDLKKNPKRKQPRCQSLGSNIKAEELSSK